MEKLCIHQEKITPESAAQLAALCPFGAIHSKNGVLSIDAGCKMCKLCVKNGPAGAITLEKAAPKNTAVNLASWQGVAVFAQQEGGQVHKVSLELLGKARALAAVCGQPVLALLVGSGLGAAATQLLRYGANEVYVYDNEALSHFVMTPYVNAFVDFIEKRKPASVLVGATNTGRSLAPRVAARLRTGLTADCTALEMKPDGSLVQIRPAFGGNIMAQIVTPRHRPQFCTVRYKVFSAPAPVASPGGKVIPMLLPPPLLRGPEVFIAAQEKPKMVDIAEADTIVAVGRGLKNKAGLALAEELARLLGAQMACTRPLVENGWFGARRQIGLSGRTVAPRLIVTLGISGAVQFAAGMRGSDCIAAVNTDPEAPIFQFAHHAFVGDLYEILPALLQTAKEVPLSAL